MSRRSVLKLGAVALLLAVCFILFGDPDVDFRSSDSQWADSEIQSKGRTFEIVVANFEAYRLMCEAPTAKLVRTTETFWINIFALPSYLTDKKWQVPYAAEDPEIETYYPPASDAGHCYNAGRPSGLMDRAVANATAYIGAL